MQLQHPGVTREMIAIKHIFHTNQIHGGIISRCSLFILSLHALALHLAVKITFKSFCMKILSTLNIHTSVGCISLQNASRTALVTQPILLSENIPNVDTDNQQNTRRSDQIETIKTIMQTRALVSWKVYQWLRLPF